MVVTEKPWYFWALGSGYQDKIVPMPPSTPPRAAMLWGSTPRRLPASDIMSRGGRNDIIPLTIAQHPQITTDKSALSSVPHIQRLRPNASKMRASGSQMSL
jgi:hypothetical protein